MNVLSFDNVIKEPVEYVKDILSVGFEDVQFDSDVFKGIQARSHSDEFSSFLLNIFPKYEVAWNFVRHSPYGQDEPNYIHKDDMMGDITCILYLSKSFPINDGTTIYDDNKSPLCVLYSKFNRMIAFDSELFHSRNIFKNFGEGDKARLIQVVFLKEKK
jgi:hypothetical protein